MSKYKVLVHILDALRKEAPENYKFYHPLETEIDKLNHARSRAFIHLFLKVKFGLLTFEDREKYVTDGTDDGGIDGYFIDNEHKVIYFIQAKFRTSEENFESKEIKYEELINMDIDRITEGKVVNEDGVSYNGKIQKLLKEFEEIPDMGRYKYEIIIIANTKDVPQNKLKKLTDGNRVTEYNYTKCYEELIFPVVSGTFYNSSELAIYLNLEDKNSEDISYSVETEFKNCEISVLFVPTLEIAKALYKYKNSILKYNPRSYLDMANGSVNSEIAKTITNKKTNEFALFNNGITALSDETDLNKKIGREGIGQLILKNPQIINGGQTAYTLSKLYEDVLEGKLDMNVFNKKEVLLKVITFSENDQKSSKEKLRLIEAISKATNQQTTVTEADRRSNDKVQIELQDLIFKKYGLFYQRKAGEFGEGLKNSYISRSQIIDREILLRLILAAKGYPSQARSRGSTTLFRKNHFDSTLNNAEKYDEYVFAYLTYMELNSIQNKFRNQPNNKDGIINYGHALRYGKFSIISVVMKNYEYLKESPPSEIVKNYLIQWITFEESLVRIPTNSKYFREIEDQETGKLRQILNYDGYYKGATVNKQVLEYEFTPLTRTSEKLATNL